MNARDRAFRFYLDNREKFSKKYPNQYVLLRGDALLGIFESYNIAEEVANRMFKDESYFIQRCPALS